MNKISIRDYVFPLLLICSFFFIGNLVQRENFVLLFFFFVLSFIAYLGILEKNSLDKKSLLLLGIACRLVFFFSLPILSDDIFRFIWDGILLENDLNPFENPPKYYLDKKITGLNLKLFEQLNSPEYFTVYTPINQYFFWLSVHFFDQSWLASANFLRIILLLADLGSLYYLEKIVSLKKYKSAWSPYLFYLNPLLIIEGVGNLHFESLVIFFLMGGTYYYYKSNSSATSLCFGLAVGVKLLPLIYLPYLFFKNFQKNKGLIGLLSGFIGLLTLISMYNEAFIDGMKKGLNLYFRTFEFNGSIYLMAKEIGIWIYGYNNIQLIGPLLSLMSCGSILLCVYLAISRAWSLSKVMLYSLSFYLLFATTVHPWYILPLLSFSILSKKIFPFLWSFIIIVTYNGYSQEHFNLQSLWIIFEYTTVTIVFLYENKIKHFLNSRLRK